MKFARLLIATAVLAALGGVVWYSNKQEAAKVDKPDPKASPKILELREADINGIEIQHKGGETTVLKKDDSNKWSISAPKPLAADQAAVASITSSTSNLASDRVVDANVSDLASYGLEPALIGVKFTMANGSSHTLRIGEDTPTGGNSYVKVDGDNRLFTMSSSTKSTFDKQSKDLREKHLLIFDSDKLSRLELEVAGKIPLEFGRAGMDWQILKPKPLRADGFQIEDLVRKLKDASMNVDDDPKASAAAYASGARVATAKVTGAEGTLTLEIHKSKDDYYAKSSAVDGVYKVTKELGDGVNKSLDDFRNKKVFDFGFNDPTRIEYKDGAKMAVFEKSGDKWTSGGKTMDSLAVQNLIDKLRDLAATKFADTGFTTAAIEMTVVSNDGKKTEKVQIAPAGTGFLARRENDMSLYQVEASAISDLRESVNGVKEPPPPDTSKDGKKK
jgi:hypothetical protein